MYADVESRGGILEPPGICEVKFRAGDQVIKMHEVSQLASVTSRLLLYTLASCHRTDRNRECRAG